MDKACGMADIMKREEAKYIAQIKQVYQECVDIPKAQALLENWDKLEKEDLSTPYINYVWRVKHEEPNRKRTSVVVKIAPPYHKFRKAQGLDFPLGADRLEKEYKMLLKWDSICPDRVLRPLAFLEKYNTMVLEDLYQHRNLTHMLTEGVVDLAAIRESTQIVAEVHRATHVTKLPDEEFQKLKDEYPYDQMSRIMIDCVYGLGYDKNDDLSKPAACIRPIVEKEIYDNQEMMDIIEEMKKVYLEKKEALIHGDCHCNNFMVKNGKSKIFDLEFAQVGPCSMDLGYILSSFLLCYYQHMAIGMKENNLQTQKVAAQLADGCLVVADTYFEHMTCAVGDREKYKEQIMSEAAAFAACYDMGVLCLGSSALKVLPDTAQVAILVSCIKLLHNRKKIHSILDYSAIAFSQRELLK